MYTTLSFRSGSSWEGKARKSQLLSLQEELPYSCPSGVQSAGDVMGASRQRRQWGQELRTRLKLLEYKLRHNQDATELIGVRVLWCVCVDLCCGISPVAGLPWGQAQPEAG
eukprot:scaffold332890_cov34-Prasinocladus_malaysianus.AAC.2